MGDSPAREAEGDDVFDHELTRVLQEHGDLLEERARALLTGGTASICGPEVTLHAQLRPPRRWRKGLLEVTSRDAASGAVLATSSRPLDRAGADRGSASLLAEITIDLALELAYGPHRSG